MRFGQHKSKAARIREFLAGNPDMLVKDVAQVLNISAGYVSMVKNDLCQGHSARPSNRLPAEPTKTEVSPWFIDQDGLRTRLIKGVAA